MASPLPTESLLTPDARQRLLDALTSRATRQGVRIEHVEDPYSQGGWYSPEDKVIALGKGQADAQLPTLAHELGHAEFDRTLLGALVQSPAIRGLGGRALPLGALIGLVAEGSFARRMALSGGVAAALQVPLLTGEAVASVRGHQMLREHGAPQELLDLHKRQMLRGFSTYLRPGAAGLAGALAGSALGAAVTTK